MKDIKEEMGAAPAAANAVAHGGVDMNPNGGKRRMTKKPLTRVKDYMKSWQDAGKR